MKLSSKIIFQRLPLMLTGLILSTTAFAGSGAKSQAAFFADKNFCKIDLSLIECLAPNGHPVYCAQVQTSCDGQDINSDLDGAYTLTLEQVQSSEVLEKVFIRAAQPGIALLKKNGFKISDIRSDAADRDLINHEEITFTKRH